MPNPAESLFAAILNDDRAGVAKLLHRYPTLPRDVAALEPRYATEVAHWIYAGDTALHAAAAGYRIEIAQKLLRHGADANAARNHRRSRPLHYAADGHFGSPAWNPERQVATIRLLLEAGADLHAQDKNGATPLHRAVRTRCRAAVACLLAAGASAAMLNKPGSTPFHLAVQNTGRGGTGSAEARTAQEQIIQAFLDCRISPNLRDRNGKSVRQWARSLWIRRLLDNHGG